ncbi:MAG: BlaI/MecI/CopY family transcriptional regulator [Anaeromicrobium sp.]|jgi:BlaI family penicillinase repressor|uniref:BlaI/MecI/CopY family transcriptional regulator n=1 Tax=Anaeromicrobium sp. TaxID=1929132 RepID=UPI0025F3B7AB|nr:BlaI/MecI/CopY family transcriptional regulator [Anaeromicrobium sp.]MCT4594224.1 BlaI/MecI/CopY family transcriptional regulator [Anaeromicrobium sp.]
MNIPAISDSEWKIMKVLWNENPKTATEIMEELEKETNWKPTTVKTLLSRLVKKEAITYENKNRKYYYTPLIGEEQCVIEESKSFLQRVYNGGVKSLVANFLHMEKLSKEDVEELKKILEDK